MNVVDSCGWLAYIQGGANAAWFEVPLADTAQLLVPAVVVYEVSRRLIAQQRADLVDTVVSAMKLGQIVQLDAAQMAATAQAAARHRLAMADAIIWHTAQAHGATLFTQDVDLQGLPGVQYRARAE